MHNKKKSKDPAILEPKVWWKTQKQYLAHSTWQLAITAMNKIVVTVKAKVEVMLIVFYLQYPYWKANAPVLKEFLSFSFIINAFKK